MFGLSKKIRDLVVRWVENVFAFFYYHSAAITLTLIPVMPFAFTAWVFGVRLWPIDIALIKVFFIYAFKHYYHVFVIALGYGILGLLPIVGIVICAIAMIAFTPLGAVYCRFEDLSKKFVARALLSE